MTLTLGNGGNSKSNKVTFLHLCPNLFYSFPYEINHFSESFPPDPSNFSDYLQTGSKLYIIMEKYKISRLIMKISKVMAH